MDSVTQLLTQLGSQLYPWLNEIATAMVACVILVFGADFNRFLRRKLGARNFVLRTLIFILVNAFGYGMLIVALSPWLARQLADLPALWTLLLVSATFIFVGSWAQRNNQS
ncbi:DUF3392 domain-containing protein [Shewanella algae]|uniref:DUF3392 domain-containing protein n=1 Tax=Shewanella algae TaxID=38313 RepID=UPI001186602C|nr:DUF3392 domain-containing protein [Shewanella algae]TVP06448.1 hypothetical protein AYI73_11005 [Shewanella algae]BCV39348.1 membrane protein [Shewanella algae]